MTRSTTRRRILQIGGATALVAAGGLIWRGYERGVFVEPSGAPYEPWILWNAPEYKGTALALVAAGVLAANPHNTQPWIFRVGDSRIEVYADTRRNLGSFDPYLREMHIGLGCAIENMVLAGPANGYAVTVEPAPGSLLDIQNHDAPVAAATLHLARTDADPDPLYDAIPKRHTNRGPYDPARGFPALDALLALRPDADTRLILFPGGDGKAALGGAIIAATQEIVADREMIEDSHRWFRDGPDELAATRSGLGLDTVGLPPAMLAAAKMLPELPAEQSHAAWLEQTRETHVPSAALLGLVAVRERYARPQALGAGRLWQRIHLAASAAGLAMHPLNQPVETIDRERQLNKEPQSEARLAAITGAPDWQPTFVFRGGYAKREAPASARRGVEDVIRES